MCTAGANGHCGEESWRFRHSTGMHAHVPATDMRPSNPPPVPRHLTKYMVDSLIPAADAQAGYLHNTTYPPPLRPPLQRPPPV